MLGESLGLENKKLTQDSEGLQTIFAFQSETFPESDYREMLLAALYWMCVPFLRTMRLPRCPWHSQDRLL